MTQPNGPTRAFIEEHFPELAALVPEGVHPVTVEFRGEGLCTHPEAWDPRWVDFEGARLFAAAPVPDGFFACGVHRAGSEYLWVLWRRGDRRFAFYDQYLRRYAFYDMQPHGGASKERVRRRLRSLLERWERGDDPVLAFSGPCGFYDPAVGTFSGATDAME